MNNNEKCNSHNGTYYCHLKANHTGRHEGHTVSIGERLIVRWTSAHGEAKFYRKRANKVTR